MDANSIAGSALYMKAAQTQQAMDISIMKQSADQLEKMANLLAQNAQQINKSAHLNDRSTFSLYV